MVVWILSNFENFNTTLNLLYFRGHNNNYSTISTPKTLVEDITIVIIID